MEQNPYEAPKEQGYQSPEDDDWWEWAKDRTMLWGCGFSLMALSLVVGLAAYLLFRIPPEQAGVAFLAVTVITWTLLVARMQARRASRWHVNR